MQLAAGFPEDCHESRLVLSVIRSSPDIGCQIADMGACLRMQ